MRVHGCDVSLKCQIEKNKLYGMTIMGRFPKINGVVVLRARYTRSTFS